MPVKLISAPLGAAMFVALAATAATAQPAGNGAATGTTILGPAMLRPGTADLSCGAKSAGLGPWGADRLEQTLSLDDAQKTKLDGVKTASAKATKYLQESCPTVEAATPTARVDALERRLEAMLEAVRTVKPALDEFYGTLSDEQKARLNNMEVADASEPADSGGGGHERHGGRRHHGHRHWLFRIPIPIPF